jgi:hypothetical protein
VFLKPVTDRFAMVPVLNFQVYRLKSSSASGNTEITQTELQDYYTTPDELIKGANGHRFTFLEAINRFTV